MILARSVEDVSEAVQFATKHNLAISVMSTGHEFQVRAGANFINPTLPKTFYLGSTLNFYASESFLKSMPLSTKLFCAQLLSFMKSTFL